MEDYSLLSLAELYQKISKLNSYICIEGSKMMSNQQVLGQLIYMKECLQEEVQLRQVKDEKKRKESQNLTNDALRSKEEPDDNRPKK